MNYIKPDPTNKEYKKACEKKKSEYRKGLEEFISKMKGRAHFKGVPKDSKERKIYFDRLHLLLQNIMEKIFNGQKIKKANWLPSIGITVVLENFSEIGSWCGGRFSGELMILNEFLHDRNPKTVEEWVDLLLYKFRWKIVLKGTGKKKQSTHLHVKILSLIGEEIGIASAVAAKYNDPFESNRKRAVIRKEFYERYTGASIVECIYQAQENDLEFRKLIIDWMQKNIPKNWKCEWGNELSELVEKGRANKLSDGEIKELLKKKGAVVRKGLTIEQGIQEFKAQEYMAEELYDMKTGKMKYLAILRMLVEFDVFQSIWGTKKEK